MRLNRIDLDLLQSFIVRQAPRAGKVNQIPRCDWLPERTTLPARDCPFCSRNNISPKFKQVHKSFLSQNIFRDSKKIFCDFSVGMELKNVKMSNGSGFACGVECVKSKCVRYVCSRRTMTTALKKTSCGVLFCEGLQTLARTRNFLVRLLRRKATMRVPKRFFRIRDLTYSKAGIRDFEGNWGTRFGNEIRERDSRL